MNTFLLCLEEEFCVRVCVVDGRDSSGEWKGAFMN